VAGGTQMPPLPLVRMGCGCLRVTQDGTRGDRPPGGQQGSDRCCSWGACAGCRRPGNVIVPRYAGQPLGPAQLHIVPGAADLNQARPGTAGPQV